MEGGKMMNKKRGRKSEPKDPRSTSKKGKAKMDPGSVDDDGSSCFLDGDDRPPLSSIFEFPWQKDNGGRLFAVDFNGGCDLRDVFFSSLVDGCKAAIGVPGDRLSPPSPATITLPEGSWPSDWEEDGADFCIWSGVLREPISLARSTVQ